MFVLFLPNCYFQKCISANRGIFNIFQVAWCLYFGRGGGPGGSKLAIDISVDFAGTLHTGQ